MWWSMVHYAAPHQTSVRLLLLHGRRQLKCGRRLATPLRSLGFQAFDRLGGDMTATQRCWMNARAVKVAAAGGNQVIFVCQRAQGKHLLRRVLAVVGFESH